MDKILSVIGGVPNTSSRNDDDAFDRMSYRYTVALLVMFSVIVTTTQYVGDPITCWVPAHFSGAWEAYVNSYCWIKNTYYLPFEEYIPAEHEHDKRQMITYYQWVPIMLLVQALLFFLPCMVWRTFNARSGIDLNNIVESGETFQNTQLAAAKEKTLGYMVKQMHRYLTSQREYQSGCTVSLKHCLSRTCCSMCGHRHGNYLVVLYLLVKVLFIANALGQLFTLNNFLGTNYHFYGIDVLQALLEGQDWTQSHRFPRVTMCDFNVRRLGNLQRYTVQCVLPINLFNEKIFLFIWFWLVILTAMTCFSLLSWFLRTVIKSDRHSYIKKHLTLLNKLDNENEHRAGEFVEKYLKQDGVFVLRLVGLNTNTITVTEFTCALWDNYIEYINQPLDNDQDADDDDEIPIVKKV